MLKMIDTLSKEEQEELQKALDKRIKRSTKSSKEDMESLLLNGPVMSDEGYAAFLENRKAMNQWRMN
jgi:heme oxygenase